MTKWSDVLNFLKQGNLPAEHKVVKTESEWRQILSPQVFQITRQKSTERPFSSEICSLFKPGIYGCACCGSLLFDATEKFESGTGWPSFTQPIQLNSVAYVQDSGSGMLRVEVICNVCEAHLGHVFPDGPPPSGLRYCMNALALKLLVGDRLLA